MADKRSNRHSNPSKYAISKGIKGRRKFIRNKKRKTNELLKAFS